MTQLINDRKKTLINKKWWLVLAIACYILFFLISRLVNIMAFPLFIDEVAHIYLAKITLTQDFFAGSREGGKQTYLWVIAMFSQFIKDPILAARVASVFAGLICAGAAYKLTNMLYPGRRIGYLAAFFYLVSPYAVLFDRMALTDSLVAALMGISLIVSFQLWRKPTFKWAIILGFVFGLAMLAKAYAILYFPVPILLWLILSREISWSKIVKLLSITYAIAIVIFLPMITIGLAYNYDEYLVGKTVIGPAETHFLMRVWQNWQLVFEWLGAYLTLPFALVLIFAVIRMIIKRDKFGFILIYCTFGPLFVFTLFFTDFYSRYFFSIIVPLSVMVAWGLNDLAQLVYNLIKKSKFTASVSIIHTFIFLIFCIPSLIFSYLIIVKPMQAPLPKKDKLFYILQAQAAYGYQEGAQLFETLIQQHGNLVFLRNSLMSPLEVMLLVYLPDNVVQQMKVVTIQDHNQLTPSSLNSYAAIAPMLTTEGDLISSIDSNSGSLTYAQLWKIASFSDSNQISNLAIYQWLLPPDFAIRWFQLAEDENPKIAWYATDEAITSEGGTLIDLSQPLEQNPRALQKILQDEEVEYILVTPLLVERAAEIFNPFMSTDGDTLTIKQIPPDWRLAFAYPNLNCQWCLFQLRPPHHATKITFSELELIGYDISKTQEPTGEAVHITLHWNALVQPTESYVIFIHLLDENGQLVNQIDEPPMFGLWPTNTWQPGTQLADRHSLILDKELPVGTYTIAVGLYNPATLGRLSVEAEKHPVTDNAVILTEITIP